MSAGSPNLEAEALTKLIDVRRTWWLDTFFDTWRFDTVAELLDAVRTTDVDLPTFTRSRDLQEAGLGSWGYWFLFVKGWLEYVAAGAVTDENTYATYMTTYFNAELHDPGIAELMRDVDLARSRVELRFADLDAAAALGASDVLGDGNVAPLRIWISEPAPAGAKILYEAPHGRELGPAMVDGHHRLFAARLFGLAAAVAAVELDEAAGASLALALRIDQVVRFTVPHRADFAVAVDDGHVPPVVTGRSSAVFPPEGAEGASESQLIDYLERGRREAGWRFLVVTAPNLRWLDSRPILREHLDARYRRAANDRATCVCYVLWRDRHAEAGDAAGPDGRHVPPVEMRMLSAGIEDSARFVERGRDALAWITALLERNEVDLSDVRTVLDFGCGAGRILRHLRDYAERAAGADWNPYLMAWVSGNLSFAEASLTGAMPPMHSAPDEWDLVLAVDVFSHMDGASQEAWIAELERVARPGGVIVATVHGEGRAHELPRPLREVFDAGDIAVNRPQESGTNACAAYHPKEAIRKVFAERLELVDHVPGGATDVDQDAVLLRRPIEEV